MEGLGMRIIHDPKDKENTKVPELPLLIVFDNQVIAEANSISELVALIVDMESYLKADDETKWRLRLKAARHEAMKSLQYGQDVCVFDEKIGVVSNNYAVDPNDPDYQKDEEDEPSDLKIIISDEKEFILSLVRIEAVRVLERSNSQNFLKEMGDGKEYVDIREGSNC
jgi:hypothetical protein